MPNIVVVFESKYGNTKLVAEALAKAIGETHTISVSVHEVNDMTPAQIETADVLIIGSPNHFGGPTRGIKKFIDKLGKTDVSTTRFVFFDTYIYI